MTAPSAPQDAPKSVFRSLDWITILLYLVLITWGWFSVCGASYSYNQPDLFAWGTNSGKQLRWIGTSILLACLLLFVEKNVWRTAAYPIYTGVILLLIATVFIAPDIKGSRSWIPIGPIRLQPAEFAKFAVALAVAKSIDEYEFSLSRWRDFLRVVGLIVAPMLIIVAQKETGSALVYLAFFLVLYREGMTGALLFTAFALVTCFVVGVRFNEDFLPQMPVCIGELAALLLSQLFIAGMTLTPGQDGRAARLMLCTAVTVDALALLFSAFVIPFNACLVLRLVNVLQILLLAGLCVADAIGQGERKGAPRWRTYLFITLFAVASTGIYYAADLALSHLQPHQRIRIEVLLGKKEDLRGAGYNVNQAKIAFGSGGLSGKGFLMGTQTKLKYVPEQDTDFIFCTVGEEEGFLGCAGVLLVYLLFIWRLIALAERQPDPLGRVYGYCVCCVFLFHLFINVGMVLGLTPVIGIPLPFFSYGGSSLWGFTILLFIFLRMDAERNVKEN